MSVELATAYVSVVPSTKGIAGQLQKEFGDPLEEQGGKTGNSLADKFSGAAVAGLKVAGGLGIAAFGASLVSGFNRLQAIDDARFKLAGLGHDAETVDAIMVNALGSVKGTAFGLGDAATIAAGAVAAGIKPGNELERTLSLTGDAATIAGTSLDEMGGIFNKVAASNRLSMLEVNQLALRGVPIMQWLADEYGVTADAAREMVSDGAVDFATFQKVIEENIGGAALTAGESFAGSFANMGAALGRFGATLLGPTFEAAKGWFTGITSGIDTLTAKVAPFGELISGKLTAAVSLASDAFGRLSDWWATNGDMIIGKVTVLGDALMVGLGGAFDFVAGLWTSVVKPAFDAIRRSFTDTDGALRGSLIGGFDLLVGALERFGAALSAAGRWMAENKTAVQAFAWVIGGLLLPHYIALGVAATVSAAQSVAAWVMKSTAALRHGVSIILSLGRVVAGWVASGAAALVSGVQTAYVWLLLQTSAIKGAAAHVKSVALAVKAWVVMGAKSLLAAGKVALAWLIAIGPIALVIAAVVGLVVLIVKNWDRIRTFVTRAARATWDFVVRTFNRMRDGVRTAISSVVSFVSGLPGRLLSALASLATSVVSFVARWHPVAVLLRAMRSGQGGMLGFVRSIPGRIRSGLGNLGRLLFNAGKAIIRGLINGIRNMVGGVKNAVSGVLSAARNLLPFSPAKEGPFSGRGWTLYAGESIGKSLAEGIGNTASLVRASAAGIAGVAQKELDATPILPDVASSGTFDVNMNSNVAAGQQTVIIELDGREIGRRTMRHMPGVVKVHAGVRA